MDKKEILETLTILEQNGIVAYTWDSIVLKFDNNMLTLFSRYYKTGEIVVIQDQKCILETCLNSFFDEYIEKVRIDNEAVNY